MTWPEKREWGDLDHDDAVLRHSAMSHIHEELSAKSEKLQADLAHHAATASKNPSPSGPYYRASQERLTLHFGPHTLSL